MAKPKRNREGRFETEGEDAAWVAFLSGKREADPSQLPRQALLFVGLAADVGNRTPSVSIAALRKVKRRLDELELYAVANARYFGWSWQTIASALGVSKQSVHRRYRWQAPEPRLGPPAPGPDRFAF